MSINFPQIEEKILAFWREKNIFAKTLAKTKNGKPFVFFEGPPTANALPGIHHVLSRIFKDIIPRYKTMQGYYVERKAGWDTHGLPVELEMEKKLGIRGKPEIEKYGIAEFNQKCKESVWQYKKEWEDFSERIGFWLDYEHAYITYENYYIETLWWILKQIWDKGLLFQDYKVVPHCPRCGTTLSSHEVALGYENVEDVSLYLKFEIRNSKSETNSKLKIPNSKTYFFVWTTTPWTLPGNVAIAVHPKAEYVKVRVGDEFFILAEQRLSCLARIDADQNADRRGSISVNQRGNPQESATPFEVVEKYQGKDLIGKKYEGLYPTKTEGRIYEIISGDFVSMEDGTGLVHIAPAFGEDDMNIIKMTNDKAQMSNGPTFPILMTVEPDGSMSKGIIAEGKFVKDADKDVLADLKKRNLLWKEEKIRHDYPFCWRCDSPLIYYAKKSWFIKMSEPKIKEQLIKNNETINWVPDFIKRGRFGVWLEELKDWALSRERYWGTPLPVWMCQTGKSQKIATTESRKISESQKDSVFLRLQENDLKPCGNIKVIGSFEELEKLTGKKITDPHRPFIDEFTFKCEKCGGEMKRVPEVIDCWFDSGAMPFAQHHYPFENKERYEKNEVYPANYIAEGLDQTRGWFYTLLAISTLLDKEPAYKNVICHGLVLDEKGEKMSKTRGNVVVPQEMVDKYGADALRFYFYSVNQPNDSKYFSEKQVEDAVKKVFLILWNVISFYQMYVGGSKIDNLEDKDLKNVLDKWIAAKLNLLIQEVSKKLDKYDIMTASRDIAAFIDELSTWYLRRSRERFKSDDEKIKMPALKTLRYVIFNLTKLMAPFTPFIVEHIYQEMKGKEESIHLENWPKVHENWIDEKTISQMAMVREIAGLGLEQRAKNKIAVRQPLAKIIVKFPGLKKLNEDLEQIILDELNIKKIEYQPATEKFVELDTVITAELEEEGIIRELIRHINDLRKKSGLTIKDKVKIYYQTENQLAEIIEKKSTFLKKQTLAEKIERKEKIAKKQKEVIIDNQKIAFDFEK